MISSIRGDPAMAVLPRNCESICLLLQSLQILCSEYSLYGSKPTKSFCKIQAARMCAVGIEQKRIVKINPQTWGMDAFSSRARQLSTQFMLTEPCEKSA